MSEPLTYLIFVIRYSDILICCVVFMSSAIWRLNAIGVSLLMKSVHGYVPLVVSTSRFFPHSWLITGFVTRITRRVPLVEQELLTLPEHLSSLPVLVGFVLLVLCVCFIDRCLCFCSFSFGYYVVCSSSIYRLWLPLWYLHTLLVMYGTPEVDFEDT